MVKFKGAAKRLDDIDLPRIGFQSERDGDGVFTARS